MAKKPRSDYSIRAFLSPSHAQKRAVPITGSDLWATPLFSTENTWTLKFAMGQADVEKDWDTYVAELEGQNAQNVLDMYNDYYQKSKTN